jgi:hypothetical protein
MLMKKTGSEGVAIVKTLIGLGTEKWQRED